MFIFIKDTFVMTNAVYGYITPGSEDKYHAVFTYWVPECCRKGINNLFKDPYNRFSVQWDNEETGKRVEVSVPITKLKSLNNLVFDSLARVMVEIGSEYKNDIEINIYGYGDFQRYRPQGRPKHYITPTDTQQARVKYHKNYLEKREQLVKSLTQNKGEDDTDTTKGNGDGNVL